MKYTLLVENNSLYDKFLHAEHGMSAYIIDDGVQVLYDCGYSDAFIKNAEALGIDLTRVEYVILSHGHYDHSGGLKYLMDYYKERHVYHKPILLMADEDIFLKKYNFIDKKNTGMDVTLDRAKEFFDVRFVSEPMHLTDRLIYLGKAPRLNPYEAAYPQNMKWKDGKYVEDYIDEDVELAYVHEDGGVSVMTGCSHSGICNIIAHAKAVTGATVVHKVIGGLHLQKPKEELMKYTMDFVQETNIENFYACHCTDFPSRLKLATISNICETGVSLTLEWI